MESPIVNHAGLGMPDAPASPVTFGAEVPQLEISGPEKAAILLITLGLELSATIFKFLRQDEVERI